MKEWQSSTSLWLKPCAGAGQIDLGKPARSTSLNSASGPMPRLWRASGARMRTRNTKACGIPRRRHKLTDMRGGKSWRLRSSEEGGELGSPGSAPPLVGAHQIRRLDRAVGATALHPQSGCTERPLSRPGKPTDNAFIVSVIQGPRAEG